MFVHEFKEPLKHPTDIPFAGVSLADLLGESGSLNDVVEALKYCRNGDIYADRLQPSDEVQKFRTPRWTWAVMGGVEGWLVLRSGNALFYVVTRMN